jgi:hypothetical protein
MALGQLPQRIPAVLADEVRHQTAVDTGARIASRLQQQLVPGGYRPCRLPLVDAVLAGCAAACSASAAAPAGVHCERAAPCRHLTGTAARTRLP